MGENTIKQRHWKEDEDNGRRRQGEADKDKMKSARMQAESTPATENEDGKYACTRLKRRRR